MLDHLHIQNYRLFKDLKIDKLGQVNLIAGKNNTGKTALLEVIRIHNGFPNVDTIGEILKNRGSFQDENISESISSLFYLKKYENIIHINDLKIDLRTEKILGKEIFAELYLYMNGAERRILSLNSRFPPEFPVLVNFSLNDKEDYRRWNLIQLTPQEQLVVEILNIIHGKIDKIAINEGGTKILLKNEEKPISIKELGDGVNRVLSIAIALVRAQQNILLIDEFEVGLHHSVQEQLWDIIFKYAKEWNIQVFATTHSQDTVKAFYYVSSKKEYKNMGQYMRLQPSRTSGEIEAVIYTEGSLETAFDLNLETR